MDHNRSLNNKINRIHARAFRIVYRDKNLTFEDFLEKDKYVTVHMETVQVTEVTGMFKVQNNFLPGVMKNVFPIHI